MLIGELSRRTGVHTHQLRYYEAQGLLEPVRGANGYREYSSDAILTVRQIRSLLKAGLSTQEIAYMLPCAVGAGPDFYACPELLAVLRARLDGLTEQVDALDRAREALHEYIAATEKQPAPA